MTVGSFFGMEDVCVKHNLNFRGKSRFPSAEPVSLNCEYKIGKKNLIAVSSMWGDQKLNFKSAALN